MNGAIRVIVCIVALTSPVYAVGVPPALDLPEADLLADVHYRTACGPIACFVAVRYFGRLDVSLDEMSRFCKWSVGQTSTLQVLQNAMRQFPELRVQAVRTSPEKLAALLNTGKYAAILTVRRNSDQVNHAVCVFGDEHNSISAVDFPKLKHRWSMSRLGEVWDGKALLISRAPEASWQSILLQSTLPGGVLGCTIMFMISRYRSSKRSPIDGVTEKPV